MPEKKKSKPIITRIKLNPEQAVLACCSVARGRGRVKLSNQCTGGGGCGDWAGALQS